MRIGVSCDGASANAHYRALIPVREMARRGHQVIASSPAAYGATFAGNPAWDVLHIYRNVSEDNLETVRRLRAHGVAVVWDNDDDIRTAPGSRFTRTEIGGRRARRRYHDRSVEMAMAASSMTTTSPQLADIYRAEGVGSIAVIPNFLERIEARARRRTGRIVVVGLVAAVEHQPDLDGLKISKVLREVQQRHEHVHVVSIGLALDLRERYTRVQHVPFERLLQRVCEFDIGLAPLVDSPFSRARSDVKLKEYAASSVPWLASPVGPYVGLGQEQGGRLVDPGDWVEAIDALVRDDEARVRLADRGRAWAGTQTIGRNAALWEQVYRRAIAASRS